MRLSKSVHENIIYVGVALLVFLSEPAIARAEGNYSPINFTQPLKLSRGSLTATSPGGIYLGREDMCRLMEEENGWEPGACEFLDALVIGTPEGVDNFYIEKPNSDGYVTFDDWHEQDGEEIEAIWENYVESLKEQGKRLGLNVEPLRWYVYPTLNEEHSIMYYAVLIDWAGEQVVNASATLFDKSGYIGFTIVPESSTLSEQELEALVVSTLKSYSPDFDQEYFAFRDGDKVAAVGALGVLAGMLGVKYGKGFFAVAMAVILLIAKKAWFLVFLPFIFLARLFKRK